MVWFEGNNPQAPQEIKLNMKHIFQNGSALPHCNLFLNVTESQQVNLTIIVATAAWFYQTGNFNTSLSIDSQELENLSGIFEWQPSAMGELYNRKYNITLSGLEDGSHSIKIRVTGEYYGPNGSPGIGVGITGNYDCEGSATIIVDDQTKLSPTPTTTPQTDRNAPHLDPIYYLIPVSIIVAVVVLSVLLYRRLRKTAK